MMIVLDASALLAFLQSEPGCDQVEAALAETVISSVNWAEVVQKSIAAAVDVNGMREDLEALGLRIVPFSAEEAGIAAQLWQKNPPSRFVTGRSSLSEHRYPAGCTGTNRR